MLSMKKNVQNQNQIAFCFRPFPLTIQGHTEDNADFAVEHSDTNKNSLITSLSATLICVHANEKKKKKIPNDNGVKM